MHLFNPIDSTSHTCQQCGMGELDHYWEKEIDGIRTIGNGRMP